MTWIVPEQQRMLSPYRNRGRAGVVPDLLVIHYTAGAGDERAAGRLFAKPGRKRGNSAHFAVGRTGGVVQCVPLADTAWHAGDGMLPPNGVGPLVKHVPRATNRRSVGIELCNAGWARALVGKLPPKRVYEGRHRNPRSKSTRWETYLYDQIDALERLVSEIRAALPSLRFVCGHEDVTHYDVTGAGSKLDPGPAFPWDEIAWCLTRVVYDFGAKRWVEA